MTGQQVFEDFATAYPHETYKTWPDKFWEFFHREHPEVTREQMEKTLTETEGPKIMLTKEEVEKALAGAPVETKDGKEVTQLTKFYRHTGMRPLDFPEWHKKNQIEECTCDFQYFSLTSFYTNDVSKACSVCIHAYAEYRVREANRWRKWPEEKPMPDIYRVRVRMDNGLNYEDHLVLGDDGIWRREGRIVKEGIIAWQPLPEYKEQP